MFVSNTRPVIYGILPTVNYIIAGLIQIVTFQMRI